MVDSGGCGDGCHFDCVGGAGASSHHSDGVSGGRRRKGEEKTIFFCVIPLFPAAFIIYSPLLNPVISNLSPFPENSFLLS